MYKHVIIFFIFIQIICGQNVPLVTTTQGLVRGLASEDGDYFMYMGIPYGIVNRANPFGHSSPHPAFEGIFEAADDTAICPQTEEFNNTLAGSLDCLHLSVFVPSTGNTPKAVLVWIFGGRYEIGFYGRFLFGPKYLVRHDIILVTLNYRLGPYGFMCTDNPLVPGNQGLKDQLLALRWIKDNIENFGGDPNRITINGNSAGSMSCDFHILRNHEPRLFTQVILQAGTSMCPSFPYPNKNTPFILARHFGMETDDIPTAIQFLSQINELKIIAASEEIGLAFRPCLEQNFDGVEGFITQNWIANDSLPIVKDLNIIVGYNDEEGLHFIREVEDLEAIVNQSLSNTFNIQHEEFDGEAFAQQFYFGDEIITRDGELFQQAVNIRSDFAFIYPSIQSVDRFLKNDVKNIYTYIFSYVGGRNFVKYLNNIPINEGGAMHADEQGYLFEISFMDEPAGQDSIVLDRMTTMWANFVKYGDPTPQTSNLLPVRWEPISSTDYNYLDIGNDLVPSRRPNNERMTFLDVFFEKYRRFNRFLLEYGDAR